MLHVTPKKKSPRAGSTAYRWVIYTDSVAEKRRGAASHKETVRVSRASAKALGAAMGSFEAHLRRAVPDGYNAHAWFEHTDSTGYTTQLASYLGASLARFPLGHGYGAYGAASRGEWKEKRTGRTIVAEG